MFRTLSFNKAMLQGFFYIFKKKPYVLIGCAILAVLVFVFAPTPDTDVPPDTVHNVRIESIQDGDSLTIRLDGTSMRVRLYGIDCPELAQDYGKTAKNELLRLAPVGSAIEMTVMDTDKYGRAVAIIRRNGITVNYELIVSGAAWIEQNHCKATICDVWRKTEREAKKDRRGLWGGNPTPPWKWRKKNRR